MSKNICVFGWNCRQSKWGCKMHRSETAGLLQHGVQLRGGYVTRECKWLRKCVARAPRPAESLRSAVLTEKLLLLRNRLSELGLVICYLSVSPNYKKQHDADKLTRLSYPPVTSVCCHPSLLGDSRLKIPKWCHRSGPPLCAWCVMSRFGKRCGEGKREGREGHHRSLRALKALQRTNEPPGMWMRQDSVEQSWPAERWCNVWWEVSKRRRQSAKAISEGWLSISVPGFNERFYWGCHVLCLYMVSCLYKCVVFNLSCNWVLMIFGGCIF